MVIWLFCVYNVLLAVFVGNFNFCFQLFMAKATVQIIDCTIVVNLISLSGKSTVN